MHAVRQVFWGFIIALVSIGLILGVFSLSLVEGNMQLPSPTLPPAITLIWSPFPSMAVSPAPLTLTLTPTWTAIWTSTEPPTPSNCPQPPGWHPYTIQPGDTLDGLSRLYKKTSAEISKANCLGLTDLLPGNVVYLPPVPAVPTRTPAPCRIPTTWVIYIVQKGDSLYRLGLAYGIPYQDILVANCMTSPDLIAGKPLYVPPWATRTPSPTFPGFPTLTGTPSVTGETIPPVGTPTDIPLPPTPTP